MIKQILFIQPFVLHRDVLTDEFLIWPVYLENFLKNKLNGLKFDIIFFPAERKKSGFDLKSYKNIEKFYSQMDKYISELTFEPNSNTLICLSGTTSHQYLSVKIIAEYFQQYFSSSIIAFGGTHATVCPNDFDYDNSPIDYIFLGEGEKALYRFVFKDYKKQNIPKKIFSEPILNLDDLPPLDFSIYDKYVKYFNRLSISLSRGCPFNCNFCIEKDLGLITPPIKRWRAYSPKRAIKEISSMVKYGSKYNISKFMFLDAIFGLNKNWLYKFLELYNFPEISEVWIETRLDLLNENLIKKFKEKNILLMYGLESYSKKILKIMNKTINPTSFLNKFHKILEIHKELELFFTINILSNHPGETKETYYETFNKINKTVYEDEKDIAFYNIRFYHHFPGTTLYKHIEDFNKKYGTIVYCPTWWKNEKFLKIGPYCVRPSHELTLKESIELYTDLYKEFEYINLEKLKNNKGPDFFTKLFSIKTEIKTLEVKKNEKLKFLQENNIETEILINSI
ncbi:MAG: B12-binding domain-containing radical SAM protein [Promethearchaeia archaeon]